MTTGPLHALQVWLRHEAEEPDLELVCAEHPDPGHGERNRTVVRLTVCAQQIPGHELAELLLVGARTVLVRLDGCADPAAAQQNLEPVARVLRAAGVDRLRIDGAAADPHTVDLEPAVPAASARGGRGRRGRRRPVLDAAHLPVPRRRLLGLGTDVDRALPDMDAAPPIRLATAVRTLAAPAAVGSSAGTQGRRSAGAPVAAPPATSATSSGLQAAGVTATAAPQAEPDGLADVDSPAVVLTAPGCTACGVCVQACPTQALSLQHHGGGAVAISTLLQSPAACDGCLRCVELCPTSVLTVTGQWPWSDLLTDTSRGVATVSTATCARCSTQFPTTSGERLCPVCRYRRTNPFGSTLPPAATRA